MDLFTQKKEKKTSSNSNALLNNSLTIAHGKFKYVLTEVFSIYQICYWAMIFFLDYNWTCETVKFSQKHLFV